MSTVKLQSADGDTFDVDLEAAKGSMVIRGMLNNSDKSGTGKKKKKSKRRQREKSGGGSSEIKLIPVPKVKSETLEKVIEWLNYHKSGELPEESDEEEAIHDPRAPELNTWENNFLNKGHVILAELITAATFLQVNDLADACAKKIAGIISGKSPEEIRALFNIEDNLSPDEKLMVQYENDMFALHR